MTDKEKMSLIYEQLYKQQQGNVITITRNELNFLVIQVEKLEKEVKLRKQYESFLTSVIRSGEIISDEQTFDWFCERRDQND